MFFPKLYTPKRYTPKLYTPKRYTKAFTLLELIVVIVILGILAAIAIPSFIKTINKSRDEAAFVSLEAFGRQASALAMLEQKDFSDTTVFTDTASNVFINSFAPGVEALESVKTSISSSALGTKDTVGVRVSSDKQSAFLSFVSKSSRCAGVLVTLGGVSPQRSVGYCEDAPSILKSTLTPASLSGSVAKNSISLSWTSVPNASSYELYRSGSNAPLYTGSSLSFTDTGLVENRAYAYTLKARNASEEASSALTLTTKDPALGVSILSGTAEETTVSLSWSQVSEATSYEVYKTGTSAPLYTGPNRTFVVSGLTDDTEYSYFIKAKKDLKESTSNTLVIKTKQTPLGTSSLGATPSRTSMRLTWTSSVNATSYEVNRVGAASPIYVGTDLQFTDTNLAEETNYTYTVTAKRGSRTSVSNPITVKSGANPVSITDNFNRFNSTGLGATSDGKAAWETLRTGLDVRSNKVYSSSNALSVVDLKTSDLDMSVSAPYAAGIAFRVVDVNNYVRVVAYSNTLSLQLVRNGIVSTVRSASSNNAKISVSTSGPDIVVSDSTGVRLTESFNDFLPATKAGIFAAQSDGYLDDFYAADQALSNPDQVTQFGLTDTDIGSATLSWKAVGNVDLAGYDLYRDNVKINSQLLTSTSYTDTVSGTHVYKVQAVDKTDNKGLFSLEQAVIVPSAPLTSFFDNFNRPNSDYLGNTSDGKATWQQLLPAFPVGIFNNAASSPSSPGASLAAVKLSSADFDLSVKMGNFAYGGPAFRIVDNKNYLRIKATGSDVYLERVTNGNATTIRNIYYPYSNVLQSLNISARGNQITITDNTRTYPVITVNDYVTATKVGVYVYLNGYSKGNIDDLSVIAR